MQLIGAVAGLLVLLGMTNVANLLISPAGIGTDVAIRKRSARARQAAPTPPCREHSVDPSRRSCRRRRRRRPWQALLRFRAAGIGKIEVAIDWRVVLAVACLAVVAGTCAVCAGTAGSSRVRHRCARRGCAPGCRARPASARLGGVQVAAFSHVAGRCSALPHDAPPPALGRSRVRSGRRDGGDAQRRGYGYTGTLELDTRSRWPTSFANNRGSKRWFRVQSSTVRRGLDRRIYPAWPGSSQATNVEGTAFRPTTSRRFACRSSAAACSPRAETSGNARRTAGQWSSLRRWRDGCSDQTRRSDAKS